MTTVQIVGIAVAAAAVVILVAAIVTSRRGYTEDEAGYEAAGGSFLDELPQDTFARLGRAEQPVEDVTVDPGPLDLDTLEEETGAPPAAASVAEPLGGSPTPATEPAGPTVLVPPDLDETETVRLEAAPREPLEGVPLEAGQREPLEAAPLEPLAAPPLVPLGAAPPTARPPAGGPPLVPSEPTDADFETELGLDWGPSHAVSPDPWRRSPIGRLDGPGRAGLTLGLGPGGPFAGYLDGGGSEAAGSASADHPTLAATPGGTALPLVPPGEAGDDRLVPLSDVIVTTSSKLVDLGDAEVRRMLTGLVSDEIDQAEALRREGLSLDAMLQLTEAEKISRALGMHESAAGIRQMMEDLRQMA